MTNNQYSNTILTPSNKPENDGELLKIKELANDYGQSKNTIKTLIKNKVQELHQEDMLNPASSTFDNSNNDTAIRAVNDVEAELSNPEIEDTDQDESYEDIQQAADNVQYGIDNMSLDFSDSNMALVNQAAEDAFNDAWGTAEVDPTQINADSSEPDLSLSASPEDQPLDDQQPQDNSNPPANDMFTA